jgi:hypothetical protein
MEPIQVTYEEYCAIGFSLFVFGLLCTMHILYQTTHEKKKEDDNEF